MVKPIRILLVDDHELLRHGTASLLERETDIRVVAHASNGEQAIALAQDVHPDVVIMDVRMPVMNGVKATRRIVDEMPGVRVLVLTAHDEDQYVFSLLESGASGYLLKSTPVSDLVRAIRQVKAGESPLSPSIAHKVVARMNASRAEPVGDLTSRELEVLQMLAQGMSNQAIGRTMYISDRTVQAHLTNIFAKMDVSSRLDAVLKGIRRGWLVLEAETRDMP
jgi:DNA-binding NarL/FixJ family response regulator